MDLAVGEDWNNTASVKLSDLLMSHTQFTALMRVSLTPDHNCSIAGRQWNFAIETTHRVIKCALDFEVVLLASSVYRDVNGGHIGRNWLRQWFQPLNLPVTFLILKSLVGQVFYWNRICFLSPKYSLDFQSVLCEVPLYLANVSLKGPLLQCNLLCAGSPEAVFGCSRYGHVGVPLNTVVFSERRNGVGRSPWGISLL